MDLSDEEKEKRRQEKHAGRIAFVPPIINLTGTILTVLSTLAVAILGLLGAHGGIVKSPGSTSITFPRKPNTPIIANVPTPPSQPCNSSSPKPNPGPVPLPMPSSDPHRLLNVPEVAGKTLSDAITALEDAGFPNAGSSSVAQEGMSYFVTANDAMRTMISSPVVSCNPSPGSPAPADSTFHIFVKADPSTPAPTTP